MRTEPKYRVRRAGLVGLLLLAILLPTAIGPRVIRAIGPYFFQEGLRTLGGQPITDPLAVTDTPVVLVIFWSVSCPYCHEELMDFAQHYEQIYSAGVGILAVNVGDSQRAVEKYLAQSPLPFPVLIGMPNQFQGLPTNWCFVWQDGEWVEVFQAVGVITAHQFIDAMKIDQQAPYPEGSDKPR